MTSVTSLSVQPIENVTKPTPIAKKPDITTKKKQIAKKNVINLIKA